MEQTEYKSEKSEIPQQCQQMQCPLLGAYQVPQEDEVSLMDYWRVVWPRRWMIVGITFCAALLAIIYSLSLPNIYRGEVLLAPVGDKDAKGGLSSALGSLGGLASMAGISLPGGGNIEETLAVLKSREFLLKFVEDKKLMPILFAEDWDPIKKTWLETDPEKQPADWSAYRLLTNGVLNISQDKKTSLVTLGIEWIDAELAASWANELVERLNEYLRRQAIARSESNLKYLNEALTSTRVEEMRQTLFTLIADEQQKAMLANTQEQFAFRVLDQAKVPDIKSRPNRVKIVMSVALLGSFFSVCLIFFLSWVRKPRKLIDPISSN